MDEKHEMSSTTIPLVLLGAGILAAIAVAAVHLARRMRDFGRLVCRGEFVRFVVARKSGRLASTSWNASSVVIAWKDNPAT